MAKRREGEKRVQLCFIRPEDVRLYEFMCREAYRCRWDIQTFCIASLTEAFKEKMEEYEVESLAAEAAQKVQERVKLKDMLPLNGGSEINIPVTYAPETPKKPTLVSMDEAARQAEAQIAQLDAVAAKTMGKISSRRGAKNPPTPPPLPTSNMPATGKLP